MKKILFLLALSALTMSANAATRHYMCAITNIKVDTTAFLSKNQFVVTFNQTCKNTAEYNLDTVYYSTVRLLLNSDDRTLDGVYTTEGASRTSTEANENDQTIGMIQSEFTSGNTSRSLYRDESYVSTFVINRLPNNQFSIGECTLYFSQRLNQTDLYIYHYCYAEEDISKPGISPTPYIFEYTGLFQETQLHYDMDVTGLKVERSDSEYEALRYLLTLDCKGTNRETNAEHNYEVQLAIYPMAASIVGTFSTKGQDVWMKDIYSYVKDLNASKTRYLDGDSISVIQIKSKGDNQYSFYGGTLICTDIDLPYLESTHNRRVETTHYYHFGDDPIEFVWDGTNTELLPQGIVQTTGDLRPITNKILRDGKLFIQRGDKTYNAQGAVMK